MISVDDVFHVTSARSKAFGEHEEGDTAFISNTHENNGVLGYVEPLGGDRIFTNTALVVSTFCEASVQLPPFVARGNGGSGLIVLEPRVATSNVYLAYIAAYMNLKLKWRFNWYRQATADRIRRLQIPESAPKEFRFSVDSRLPPTSSQAATTLGRIDLSTIRLGKLFSLSAGPYHELDRLSPGNVPVVSCGDNDNGIAGYYDVPAKYQSALTIALNGNTLTAKFHPYSFSAKDDVAVCTPRQSMRTTTLLFVQLMLNRERWRYSYYRKCYLEKLNRFEVALPTVAGQLDEETMSSIFEGTSYWAFLNGEFSS